jgi:hypothetical protein
LTPDGQASGPAGEVPEKGKPAVRGPVASFHPALRKTIIFHVVAVAEMVVALRAGFFYRPADKASILQAIAGNTNARDRAGFSRETKRL